MSRPDWKTKPYWDDTSPCSVIDPGAPFHRSHLGFKDHLGFLPGWSVRERDPHPCSDGPSVADPSLFLFFRLVALLPLLHLSIHPSVDHLCLISTPSSKAGNVPDLSVPACCLFLCLVFFHF